MGIDDSLPLQVMTEGLAYAKLDFFGREVILEHISSGRTYTEIAAAFEVPQFHFRSWMSKAISHEQLQIAVACCADSLITRALYATTNAHGSADEQRAMKEYAKQLREIAACMMPETWMPSKITNAGMSGVAAVTVNIMPAHGQSQDDVIDHQQATPMPMVPPGAVPMRVIQQPQMGNFGLPKTAATANQR